MTIATFGGWRAFVYQITCGLSERNFVVQYYLFLFFCFHSMCVVCGDWFYGVDCVWVAYFSWFLCRRCAWWYYVMEFVFFHLPLFQF